MTRVSCLLAHICATTAVDDAHHANYFHLQLLSYSGIISVQTCIYNNSSAGVCCSRKK